MKKGAKRSASDIIEAVGHKREPSGVGIQRLAKVSRILGASFFTAAGMEMLFEVDNC